MYEFTTHEHLIPADTRTIYSRVWSPVTAEKRPAIIFSHGYNGCHSDFVTECEFFAGQGFVCCSIDFCGGSTRSRSTGKSTDMTLFTERDDLLAVYDHIAALNEVDEHAVFLLGGSQGGLVTAMAAEERPARGMILYFPAFSIPDNWRGRFGPVEAIPETHEFWGLTLGRGFFASMHDFSPFDCVGGYSGPVLILQGDQDGIIPVSVAQRAAGKYGNAELVILPGEGHGFSHDGLKTAMTHTLRILKTALER